MSSGDPRLLKMDGTTDKQDLGDICVGGSLEMTDEELAKRLQVEEEEEYQNFLKARKTQCDLDYKLASVLADDSVLSSYSADLFDISESKSTGSSPCASSVNAKIRSHAKDSSKANSVIIISDDELDVTKDFEELERAVEQQTEEADEHFSAAAAEEDREGSELTELLENDDYLDRLIADDNDMADIGSDSFFSTASSSLSTTSSSSGHMTPILNEDDRSNENGSSVDPDRSEYQTDNRFTDAPRTEENEGVMISTLNSAWNVIGSAINLLSDLLSPRPTPSVGERGEDVACEFLSEELGYEADEDYDDDDDYDEDDEGERDEENEFDDMSEGHGSGSEFTLHFDEDSMDQGLCPEEIEILPTRTYRPLNKQHSNPSQNLVEDSELMECQVCLNEFTEGELLRMLPCCHQFHAKCIDVWLRRDDICPVCRLRVGAELFAA